MHNANFKLSTPLRKATQSTRMSELSIARNCSLSPRHFFGPAIESSLAIVSGGSCSAALDLMNGYEGQPTTFSTSENNFSSGPFGRVTRVQPARVMQFALKYVF
jgi:hypothetical protein